MPKNGTVDERIVEMRIDNKNFESGAKTTISTLEKLEKALHLKGDTSAIDNMEKAVNKFDASSMSNSLEKVQMSFSALEVAGLRVIQNLTDSIYNFATKTVKSLTVDQLAAGWNKYEKMIESTQTIMAATAGEVGEGLRWETQEQQMADIQKYLDGLLWYADETSYSFTDMTDNLGKFLAAGVDLEKSYKSMMGIASWGATAGAKPAEVARAMYNISQAMGTGAMKAIDWKSIENANMATLDFKRNAIMVAAQMGKLDEVISEVAGKEGYMVAGAKGLYDSAGYIKDMTDEEVEKILITAENFRDGLQQNWFDKDVMAEVFERYGRFAEQLRQETEKTGAQATDLLQLLDKYRAEQKNADYLVNWKEYADDLNMTVDELKQSLANLDAIGISYSETGFRMGQEAKTFTDALEATKDAVSSQWMQTWKYIFGDYLQAKKFWTQVTGELWDIFASGGDKRNKVLKQWSEAQDEFKRTGRDYLLGLEYDDSGEVQFQGALWNLLDAVRSVTGPINEAFAEVFGLDTEKHLMSFGDRLRELTKRFQEFTAELGFSESAQAGIKKLFTALFTTLKTGIKIGAKIVQVFGKIAMIFGNVLDGVISLTSALGDLITGKITFEEFAEQLQTFYQSVKDSAKNAIKSLIPTEEQLLGFYERIKTKYAEVKEALKQGLTIENLKKLLPSFGSISQWMDRIWESFKTNYPQIAAKLEEWKSKSFLGGIITDLTNGLKSISKFFSGLEINTEGARAVFKKFAEVVAFLFGGLFGNPEEVKQKVETLLNTIWQSVQTWASSLTFGDVLKAIRTAGFTVLLAEVGQILSGFKQIEKEFAGIPQALSGLLGNAGQMLKDIGKGFRANAYIKMAVAIGILALALWGLSKIPEDKLTHVAVTLAMLIGVLSLFANKLSGMTKIFGSGGDKINISLFSNFASALIGFGLVIAAVAATILVARNVDPWKLVTIVAGIGFLLAEMAVIVHYMGQVKFENSAGVIGSIIAFSLALDLLIPVMVVMAAMPWNAWLRAVFGIAGLFAILGVTMVALSKFDVKGGNMLKLAGSIAIMAVALDLLIPIFGVLAAMSGATYGKMFVKMIGILVVLGTALVTLGAITNKLNIDGGKMLAIAGAIAILALAMDLMVPAILAFAAAVVAMAVDIPWETMSDRMEAFKKALGKLLGLAAVMVVFGAAAVLIGAGVLMMGTGFLTAGAGALLFGVALGAIATGISKLGEMLPGLVENLQKTGEMITWQNVGNILKGAVAFGLLGAAIYLVAKALGSLFSQGDVSSKIGSFGGKLIAGISSMFKALSGSIGNALPQILQVLGSLLIVVGLYLVGLIPSLTNIIGRAIITLLESIHQSVRANKGALEHSIFGIVETILEILLDSGTWVFSVVRSLIDELVSGILNWIAEQVEKIPGVGAKWANSIRGLADQLPGPEEIMAQWSAQRDTNSEWLQQFVPPASEFQEVTSESLDGAIAGISGKGAELTNAIDTLRVDASTAADALGTDIGTSLTTGAENTSLEGGASAGTSFMTAITGSLNAGSGTMMGLGQSVMNQASVGANAEATGGNPFTSGGNFVAGVASGTYSRIQEAYDAGFAVGQAEMQGYDDATSTHSPSREMVKRGIYAIQGLVKGLEKNQNEVYRESSNIGTGMLSALQSAMAQVAVMASDEFDISPVITPVVDMSNITAASGMIGGVFGGTRIGLSGEITNSVGRRLEQAERVASNVDTRNETINNNGDQFTFNIYAAEGMDENMIADAVMEKMQSRMVRRSVAFG